MGRSDRYRPGRLTATLRLPGTAPIVPLGVVIYSYLKLKLHLRAAGFAASFHDYDWRLGVDELGRSFADRLRNEPSERLAIVAHSMGGLVSRAAVVLPGAERVERVLLLGSPNYGSFATIQALRGTYAVVRKLARLAGDSSAEFLSGEIFNTFPSLYQMLPAASCSDGTDLFDAAPGPAPDRNPMRLCWSTRAPYKAHLPIQTRDSPRLLESARRQLPPSAGAPTISSIRSPVTVMAPCPR